MLNFGNKEFRNLQEQVQKNAEDIQKFNYGGAVLAEFGIRVIGRVDSEEELPDTAFFSEEDVGDAYAVGEEDNPPYELYVLTRPFIEGDPLQWFYIGRFPEPGPQGPQGEQGEPGAQGSRGTGTFAGAGVPVSVSGYINGDIYIDGSAGGLYRFNGTMWTYAGSLRGPQGPQGIQGEQGPQGPQGETGAMGPQGDPGTSYIIMGQVANTAALPDDLNQVPNGAAYLVGTSVPYTLYVLSASTPREWINAGAFNDAYNVSVVSLSGTSGTLNAADLATLTSSVQAMIKLNNEDIFRLNNQTSSVLVYNMLDRYNVQIPTEKYIIITKSSGAWSLASEDLLVQSSLNNYYTKTEADSRFQATLVNTQNIKSLTKGGVATSLLGSGTIDIDPDLSNYATLDQLNTVSTSKQDKLTSGSTIKTINNESILGSGNINCMTQTANNGISGTIYTSTTTADIYSPAIIGDTARLRTGLKNGNFYSDAYTTLNDTTHTILQIKATDANHNKTITLTNSLSGNSDALTIKLPNKSGTLATLDDITVTSLDWDDITNKPTFATVATSGSYNDLLDKPTIPTVSYPVTDVQVDGSSVLDGTVAKITLPNAAIWGNITGTLSNQTDLANALAAKANSAALATVATSGSYNDLSNKPSLFSGSYNDLTDKPSLFSGDYDDLTDKPNLSVYALSSSLATVATSGSYNDLSNKPSIPTVPTNVSDFTNDAGYITSSALSGYATETYVNNAIQGLGTVFNIKGSVATVSDLPASGNTEGDVYYVESVQAGYIWIEINNTEQWEELGEPIDLSGYVQSSDLATVATTGDYSDLLNKPSIPTVPTNISSFTNDSGYITSSALSGYALSSSLATVATSGSYNDLSNKPSLATVATSGSYNDLSNKPSLATVATTGNYSDLLNKPTIPVVSYPVTDVTVGGTSVVNSTVAAIPAIPTKVSDLNNDSGFTTNTGTVTSVRVQAGAGLASSQNTAQTSSLDTTISIDSGYKLPTTTEWGNLPTAAQVSAKQDASTAYNTSNIVYSATQPSSPVAGMIWLKPIA